MKKIFLSIPFLISYLLVSAQLPTHPDVILPTFKADTVDIRKLGAIADGHFLNTTIINSAISDLAKRGGGVVMVPAGLWYTGPLVLQSNINLHLDKGATLLFTKDKNQYPLIEANYEGLPQMRNQAPISATKAENIAITGEGIVDGNGDAWRVVKLDKLNAAQQDKLIKSGGVLSDDRKLWFPSEAYKKANALINPGEITKDKNAAFYQQVKDFLRPNMVVFTECKYILLAGVTFQNSPAWCLHPLMSSHITVKNVSVKNPWYASNGDGIDVESCKNVWIENSVFDVGDDALCMKSGRDAAGRKRGMPVENVWIENCTVYAAHGGFVIGSEMSGGAKNIYVNNCTFIGTDIGLRFKSTRGRGGEVSNIFVNNIFMKDIVGEAILFDMYYMAKDPVRLPDEKADLQIVKFMSVDETTPVFKNFKINNIYVNGCLQGVFFRGLPEMHIKNVSLSNLVIQGEKGIELQEASGISFKNVQLFAQNTSPLITVVQSDDLNFEQISTPLDAKLFMRISGDRSKNIQVKGVNILQLKEQIRCDFGAKENQIKLIAQAVKPQKISEQMAETVMKLWPDTLHLGGWVKWTYDMGVVLKGFEGLWLQTKKPIYYNYIQNIMNYFVNEDGSIKTYKPNEFNIDHINNGKLVLFMYKTTKKEKYLKAAERLRAQLDKHPRTKEGGFWHKQVYPYQMWLDGLYMGEPFYAEYANLKKETNDFDDIANQFIWMEKHARDIKTGLLYHGWDESKTQLWANKTTGTSPNFWGRAMGWYASALVDALDWFPENHPKRKELIAILNRLVNALAKEQDPKTGLWYDVLHYQGENSNRNYFECSASSQFVYAIAKGVRKRYLLISNINIATKGYAGILQQFVKDDNGQTNLYGTVKVSGLGGKPYRDGSFDYYMSEPVVVNSPIGLGAFLLASNEMNLIK